MAPHWKCGSGQPVAGSNPALSATPRFGASGRDRALQTGHRAHRRGRLPVSRPRAERSARRGDGLRGPSCRGRVAVRYGLRLRERRARRALCAGLQADRRRAQRGRDRGRRGDGTPQLPPPRRPRRPERRLPGIPTYVQPLEWEVAHTPDHTILEWIDFPAVGTARWPATTICPTGSGSSPRRAYARASVARRRHGRGRDVIAGQACYTAGEWIGDADDLEGRSSAPDQAAYDRSIDDFERSTRCGSCSDTTAPVPGTGRRTRPVARHFAGSRCLPILRGPC